MKSISIILKNIRNLLPYFLLIAIYFFFVNIEATKDKTKKSNSQEKYTKKHTNSNYKNEYLKIKIPVIPYDQ